MSVIIRPALREEIPACAAIVAAALRDDAVVEAVVPREGGDRLRQLTAFYTAGFLHGAFVSGVVDTARRAEGGPILGVAAWIAPSPHPTEPGPEHPDKNASPEHPSPNPRPEHPRPEHPRPEHPRPEHPRENAGHQHPAAGTKHRLRPTRPHWYLSDIAVVAAARRGGIGSALLAHRLGRISEPAYLEATTPASRRLYQRFGFEVVAALHLTPDGYPVAMLTR
ncbi:GNAT family N-acetyltransferase [Cryptosporangium japonicum]|uniref:N-acetyltransferase domain-containing protein n=1 Tax=Cryptosporangium japonicum TaxID=80872 RepID=A0ABP3EU49_9ACTN